MADDKNTSGNNTSNSDKQNVKPAKAPKKSDESVKDRVTKWFFAKRNEYWAEFKRIVWPTREVLIKQTITVIAVSIMFGIYIAILDGVFGFLFTQFAQFTSTLTS